MPSLTLAYDSFSGNTILGQGWSLAGLSSIHRCPQTAAQHGLASAIRFDTSDQYCLDNQMLVSCPDHMGRGVLSIGPKTTPWRLIEVSEATDSGPLSFAVRSKSGLLLQYGNEPAARVIRPVHEATRLANLKNYEPFRQLLACYVQTR